MYQKKGPRTKVAYPAEYWEYSKKSLMHRQAAGIIKVYWNKNTYMEYSTIFNNL